MACQRQHWFESHKANCTSKADAKVPRSGKDAKVPVETSVEGQAASDRPVPHHLRCPITTDLFEDPGTPGCSKLLETKSRFGNPAHTACSFHKKVLAGDGETYERQAIERWISDKKREMEQARVALRENEDHQRAKRIVETGVRSPMGFGELSNTRLTPNRAVRRLCQEWKEAK